MDFNFDYSDWSEKKKVHSTPTQRNLSQSFDSSFNNQRKSHVPGNDSSSKNEKMKNIESELDFGDDFDLDFNVTNTPKRNELERKQENSKGCPESPDLFDQSPKCKPKKSEIFSKDFCLLPPGPSTKPEPITPIASTVDRNEVDDDCFRIPEPVPSTPSTSNHSIFSSIKKKETGMH